MISAVDPRGLPGLEIARKRETVGRDSVANIQILRGLAAFLVVVHHLLPAVSAVYPGTPHFRPGAFGVDIFFVISGFVMYHSNRSMDRSARTFLLARFIRIVPLYWLATLVIVALYLGGLNPVGTHYLDTRIVAESLLFVQSTFPDGRQALILSIGWTLIYELFFYAVFALTFRLRSPLRSAVAVAGAFVALIVIGRLVPLHWQAAYFTAPILIEFLFGAALALVWPHWPERRGAMPVAVGSAAILIGFALVIGQDVLDMAAATKDGWRFLAWGAPAFLIVAGALALERAGWRLERGFGPLLGAASYALYLFHPVLIQIAVKVTDKLVHLPRPAGPLLLALAAMALALAGSLAIHLWLERPLLAGGKWLMKRLPGGRPTDTVKVAPVT